MLWIDDDIYIPNFETGTGPTGYAVSVWSAHVKLTVMELMETATHLFISINISFKNWDCIGKLDCCWLRWYRNVYRNG